MDTVLSPCGKHRYVLARGVQADGPVYACFGINPSTADAMRDDPTVRKLREFTRLHGGGSLLVGNVFSYRAADVRELRHLTVDECNTSESLGYLLSVLQSADVWVPMWGDVAKVSPRHRAVVYGFLDLLVCLSKSGGESP